MRPEHPPPLPSSLLSSSTYPRPPTRSTSGSPTRHRLVILLPFLWLTNLFLLFTGVPVSYVVTPYSLTIITVLLSRIQYARARHDARVNSIPVYTLDYM